MRLLVKCGLDPAAANAAVAGVSTEAEAAAAVERAMTGSAPEYTSQDGFLSVDGEWARYGPVQVEVHQGLARVFKIPR